MIIVKQLLNNIYILFVTIVKEDIMSRTFQIIVLVGIILNVLTSCNNMVSTYSIETHYESDNDSICAEQSDVIGERISDTIPLVFQEYGDFLIFCTQHKLNPDVYPNYNSLLQNYKLNDNVCIDIKKAVNLKKELSSKEKETIVIIDNNEFKYCFEFLSEDNKWRPRFSITVKSCSDLSSYYKNSESFKRISRISDTSDQEGTFLYNKEDIDEIIYKGKTGYRSITLIKNNMLIQIYFDCGELNQEQIKELCGERISALVDFDNYIVNEALERLFTT